MSLLKLTPDVTRLRRIAKACAAGEVSRLEYRQARRKVIARLEASMNPNCTRSENTVPRFDAEVTQRRSEPYVEPTVVAPQLRSFWLLVVTLGVLILAMPLWAATDSAQVAIPAVDQRDPNPRTSPSFVVDQVVWEVPSDVGDELADEAQQFLAQGLDALRKENQPESNGFTQSELKEVGRFLNAIGVHDEDTRLNESDLADLRALVAQQKQRRGISLIQLEQLAQQLQTWLRGQGYVLARAYVPAQQVLANTVRLDVQFGVLAKVSIDQEAEGSAPIAGGALLAQRFDSLIGERVKRAPFETQLNVINRVPGLQTEAVFKAGDAVGETHLGLKIKQLQRSSYTVGLDNYAPEGFGEERLWLSGWLNNLRGAGDVLSAFAGATLDGADHQHIAVGYSTPVLAGRFDLNTQLAYSDVALDTGETFGGEFAGDGVLFDAKLRDTHTFTRQHRRELVYRLGVHDLSWEQTQDQRTTFVGVGIHGHQLWDAAKISLSGAAEVLVGTVDEARVRQDDHFWRLNAHANVWTPIQIPGLASRSKVVLDARFQYTHDHLPPTLRFGATGPDTNRGFTNGRVLIDQGLGLNTALQFGMPHGRWWAFVDATYGEVLGQQSAWLALTTLGLGWEADIAISSAGRLNSRITIGQPVSQQSGGIFEDEGTHLYWSIKYVY